MGVGGGGDGGGWAAGSSGNKTNSASNWVEVEVEAELGNNCFIVDQEGKQF